MINLPSKSTHFVFPFGIQHPDVPTIPIADEVIFERPELRRLRSKSLPLPGAFPITPEEVDLALAPWSTVRNEDDLPTPMPRDQPVFPEHYMQQQLHAEDVESVA